MSVRKTSDIWSFFTKSESGNATCNICNGTISYKSTITNLKKHLQRKHIGVFHQLTSKKRPASPADDQLNLVEIPNADDPPTEEPMPSSSSTFHPVKKQKLLTSYVSKNITLDQKKQIDRDLLDLFIKDIQPFSIVEDEGFKNLMKWIPGYNLPSRKTISKSMIPALYYENLSVMKDIVSSE